MKKLILILLVFLFILTSNVLADKEDEADSKRINDIKIRVVYTMILSALGDDYLLSTLDEGIDNHLQELYDNYYSYSRGLIFSFDYNFNILDFIYVGPRLEIIMLFSSLAPRFFDPSDMGAGWDEYFLFIDLVFYTIMVGAKQQLFTIIYDLYVFFSEYFGYVFHCWSLDAR